MTDQLRRTLTLLETLLDYLPGPQMIRSQADLSPLIEGKRTEADRVRERDRQIAHIELMARMRAGDFDGQKEPWEAARREQYATGDYAALDLALVELELANHRHHDLAWRVATHHPGVLDRELRVELVVTVRWLSVRLPRPVRLPTWATPSAPPTPMHLAALRDLGVPVSVLARVYGKDVRTIRNRARKATA